MRDVSQAKVSYRQIPRKLWLLIFTCLLHSCEKPTSMLNKSQGAGDDTWIDKWQVTRVAPFPGSAGGVILDLDSDNVVQESVGKQKPRLRIRCVNGQTTVTLWTGTDAEPEVRTLGEGKHSLTLQIEGLDPEYFVAREFGRDELFLDGQNLAERLARVQRLEVTFTPLNAEPAVARFDVRGLSLHISAVADACGWKLM